MKSIIQCMVEDHKYKYLKYFIQPAQSNKSHEAPTNLYEMTESNESTNNENTLQKTHINFTLDNMINYPLDTNVLLSVYRQPPNVTFKLSSDHNTNLYDYLNDLIKKYNKYSIENIPHKNSIQINMSTCEKGKNTREVFTRTGLAITHALVTKYNVKNYRILDEEDMMSNITNRVQYDCDDDDDKITPVVNKKYKYMLNNMNQYPVFDDIVITIKASESTSGKKSMFASYGDCLQRMICIIESDETCLNTFVSTCIKEYNEKTCKKNIIYHFIYNGSDSKDAPSFMTNVLHTYEKNEQLSLSVFNEHAPHIKRSIDKLNDTAYYTRNGLKRKLGYLFHGQPGTGKTMMVSKMALYDKRHVLEIPFSVIKKREEFINLMSTDEINGIPIDKKKLIIMFDEIDIGIKKFDHGDLDNETNNKKFSNTTIISVGGNDHASDKNDSAIQLDTILSQLDGVTNYDGLIIVATTNNKDRLDPALCREMRLTPLEFSALRREDVVGIIERFYNGSAMSVESCKMIVDRVILPSHLVYHCDKFLNEFPDKGVDDFVVYYTGLVTNLEQPTPM